MATIGPKEAARKAMREAKMTTPKATAKARPAAQAKPAAPETTESSVSKKKPAKKAAAKAKAKKPPKIARAKAAAPKKAKPAKPGVDRRPLTVGTFVTRPGGCTMAELEREFKMDAHPLRSKIFTAKHVLGFTIEYDAKEKRYTGTAPRIAPAPLAAAE
jgi:hypothetical protein